VIGAGTVPFRRHGHAQEAECPHLAEDLAREPPGRLPLSGARGEHASRELARRVADQFVLLGQYQGASSVGGCRSAPARRLTREATIAISPSPASGRGRGPRPLGRGRVRDGTDIRHSLTLPIPLGWAPSSIRFAARPRKRERDFLSSPACAGMTAEGEENTFIFGLAASAGRAERLGDLA